MEYTTEEIIEQVRNGTHEKVRVAVADIDGVLRGKYLHKDKFLGAATGGGFGFCNVVFGWDCNDECYDNVKYTGWHTGYPDALSRIDLSTFRRVPWNDNVPFFLADFFKNDGTPLEICPRQLLKRVIVRAQESGYEPVVGFEFEWFNFRETPQSIAEKKYVSPTPLTPGMFGYSILRSSQSQDYFMALMDELRAFDVPLEGLHTETGPGAYEAAIMKSNALEAADRALLLKSGVKEIAGRFNILPGFMAKWNDKLPGCSGHIHQSLCDSASKKNLFYDEKEPDHMSSLFRSYLAGQMQLLPEILPFFAPTINSYKRLVEGHWAPTRVTWGVDNRTAAFRAIPAGASAARLETRVTGSDINPYIALAAALAAGLYGIEKNLEPPPPIKGNAYEAREAEELPKNLLEATKKLAASTVARQLFGEQFVDHFVNTRLWEWRRFERAVTSWEMERYLEII